MNNVSEKYKNLSNACKKYPEIVLHGSAERRASGKSASIYVKPVSCAKNGFVEKFCL